MSKYGIRGFYRYDEKTKTTKKVKAPRKLKVKVHHVITDEIAPLESMATADKEIFTSKSKYRAHLKDHGFAESYGDQPKAPRPKSRDERRLEVRADAEKAYYDIKYQRVPISEREKQICQEEQRQLKRTI